MKPRVPLRDFASRRSLGYCRIGGNAKQAPREVRGGNVIGTIVNAGCIAIGSIVGSILKKGLSQKMQDALFCAMGLAALGIGINSVVQNMPNSNYPVLFIASLALGSVLGTALDLDERFQRLSDKLSKGKGQLGRGLSTGILLFCIGTLSILGPIQSALYGDHTYLFANATLDLVTSMVLASAYGIGMILTAVVLFAWQGSIYGLTLLLGNFVTTDMMCELSIVGGFLIASTGITILGVKDCKTMNMLPSLIVPIAFCAIASLVGF